MSLQIDDEKGIPSQTVEVARSAFPSGNIYMTLREEFGTIFQDEQFQELYPRRGQPAEAPWRLALVTLMQFREDLTDRQAADAVRSRIDWKYVLGLELNDPGFHYSVLCEFRTRLITGDAEQVLFDRILELGKKSGLLKERGKQRSDSTYIVAAVRSMNRVELVGETLFHVLDLLAQIDSNWLKMQAKPDWYERYRERMTSYRLPKTEKERLELALKIGQDGSSLLTQIYVQTTPDYLCKLPVVETMRRIWVQNYYQEGEMIYWRDEKDCPPCSLRIASPYDTEARRSTKKDLFWQGYKVHLSETCDRDTPNLITHVETTSSTEQDTTSVDRIHTALAEKQLLPSQHFVDAGYPSAEALATSKRSFGIDLYGPVRPDITWQAKDEQAFKLQQFMIDWEKEQVTCPMGKTSAHWMPGYGMRGKPYIQVRFRKQDCQVCTSRAKCTRTKATFRNITLQPTKEQHLALQTARERQKSKIFWETYSVRSGIEGTIDQAVDKLGMRRSRYRGMQKTHFQHLATAAAINIQRMLNWLAEVPRSVTYQSHFFALATP